MATTTITNNARRDWLNGNIAYAADTINMALYNGSGHDANTGAYTVTSEVVGTGYTSKGVVMAGVSVNIDTSNNVGYVDWSTDPSWAASTITSTDCMIFHDNITTPTVDVASYIGDFAGSRSTSSGLFEVRLPAAAYNTAVIRIV